MSWFLSGRWLAVAAAFVLSCLFVVPALADVVVQIDKSSQRMSVSVNGAPRYTWPISTGRSGYGTPSGVFAPQLMARSWFSKKYYNSPMPHSIFFRGGYGTPSGVFHPQMLARRWFSRKYYNSPMPYSIFFYHGFAIHGTTDIRRLGGSASHGCVRLHPANAATLYALVERNGRDGTRIEIH